MPEENVPAVPATSYALTSEEQMVFQTISQRIINAKLTVYNLNMQLETAQKERDQAEAQFSGALTLLANAHNIGSPANLAPDFSRIDTAKG